MKQYMLFTDLDRTLIPNGAQPESPSAMDRFRRLTDRDEIILVYVTGRHRALIEQAIAEYRLPLPDFAISDVGSEIYRIDSEGWRRWLDWETHIDPDWKGQSGNDIYHLLSVFSALRLQEAEKQNRHKLSFYAARDVGVTVFLDEIDVRLKQAGIRANLIWSIDETTGTGLLDVLPAHAGKLQAIEFLMQKLGYPHDQVVFAGDSGNDLDVLCSNIQTVLVANATAEIKQQATSCASAGSLYVSQGGYLGMNGNYSAGILEGVAHYWPEIDAWLRTQ